MSEDVKLTNVENLKQIYTSLQALETANDISFSFGMIVRKMCETGFTAERMIESIPLLTKKYGEMNQQPKSFDKEVSSVSPTQVSGITKFINTIKNFKIKWV